MTGKPAAPPRFVLPLVFIVLGPPVVGALVLATVRPQDASWSFAGGLVALLVLLAVAARRAGPRATGILVAMTTLVLLLIWPEVILGIRGFRHEPAAVIQFGYPRPEHMIELESDPELFWRLPSSLKEVNSDGFATSEFVVAKPKDTWRMVFFGDSCTYQGFPAGVAYVLDRIEKGSRRFESLNLGVPGYTSHQGRVVAERWALKLEPDVGIVYFGWNDHWQAYGNVDSKKSLSSSRVSRLLRRSRLVSWLLSLRPAPKAEPLPRPRVSVEEYTQNLETMGNLIEAAGGRVLLVTAPSAHIRRGVPDYLVEQGFVATKTQALDLHRKYNQVVGEVATRRGWRLLDLQAKAQEHRDLNDLFLPDGIHFTREGLGWIIKEIAQDVQAAFKTSPATSRRDG